MTFTIAKFDGTPSNRREEMSETFTLQQSRSHMRHSIPQEWEDHKSFGSLRDAADYYTDLSNAIRVDSAWRVVDSTGNEWDTQELLFAAY